MRLTLPIDGITIYVAPEVLRHFQDHVQQRCFDKEAGGQLFAAISSGRWEIKRATGPRPSDRRSRFAFHPDRRAEQAEIRALFEEGLHYVGDWHTHAQDIPRPSWLDIKSMKDTVQQSQHTLPGFLMAIVGRNPPPSGLWWSFHQPTGYHLQLLAV